MAPAGHTAHFRRVMKSVEMGHILVPAIQAWMRRPDWDDFDIPVRNVGDRAPDGYFHPSEHPGYPERVLYLYLTQPDLLLYEPWDPMVNISTFAGSVWHAMMEHILGEELGLLQIHPRKSNPFNTEVSFTDDEVGARGSCDGIVAETNEVFEFKTMSPRMIGKITTAEEFIERYPKYAFQAQEYMRMAGLSRLRVLCMVVSFPFDMIEFTIDYDPSIALGTKHKYATVRQAVADQRVPACGGPACAKSCPARLVCNHYATTGRIPE